MCSFVTLLLAMNGNELRAVRKKIGLTQHELSERLGVTRKTLIGWEALETDIDNGVALQVQEIAGSIRLVERTFWVSDTINNTYAVVGRRILGYGMRIDGSTILYGEFTRRDHAYRWCAALQATANPRITRNLHRDRIAEYGPDVTDN